MQTLVINCPACCGAYYGPITSKSITCEYCGTRYALTPDELKAVGFTDVDGDGIDDDTGWEDVKEVDTGSDPMPIFAQNACRNFLDAHSAHASSFSSSRKIIAGLGAEGDEIYLIHDDTLFKSGKNGFAIAQSGIYCREIAEWGTHFVSWEQFAKGKQPVIDDSYIRQGETSVAYFSDTDSLRPDLLELYIKLWKHAKRVAK